MFNTTKKYLTSALAIAGVATLSLFATAPKATAQPCGEVPCPPVGQVFCCPGSSITVLQGNGGQINVTAATNGCFYIISCTPPPPCGLWSLNLGLHDFDGVGTTDDGLTVHWRHDHTRGQDEVGSSSLQSYERDRQFPARGVIRFYAEAEIDGVPGVYRSHDQVVLENNQVMSWNPFVNETFTTTPGVVTTFVNDVSGDVIQLDQLTSILN